MSAMKISSVEKAVPVAPTGGSDANIASPTVPAVTVDQKATSEGDSFGSLVARGIDMAATVRAARVQSLAQAVRAGAYSPISARLAYQILAQADLEALLAGYLQ